MSGGSDPNVTRLLHDLTRELQTLQRELEADHRQRLSTRRQLSRFTSDVAIPGLILILETNIRALKLLRRTIRLAEGQEPQRSRGEQATTEVRDRAEQLGEATLSRLDDTLAEVQSSLGDSGTDEDVRALLDEARQLQDQISDQLGRGRRDEETANVTDNGIDTSDSTSVGVDVDAELRTLKDNLDNDRDGNGADRDET